MARLHVIFFDSSLCQVAMLQKLGAMQIVLAMMEAGELRRSLILDDPLAAVRLWSHDPELRATAELEDGRRVTAVELQLRFFDDAQRFVEAGRCEGIVPRAAEIIAMWGRVLALLQDGRSDELAGQLDWVLKRSLLRRAMAQRPTLTWQSPQMRYLDLIYSSLDPDEGLFWASERNGLVERVVTDAHIERMMREPPDDTRAWARGMLLRAAGAGGVEEVDWDRLRLVTKGRHGARVPWTVSLSNPLAATRQEVEHAFIDAPDLETIVRRLAHGAPEAVTSAGPAGSIARPLSTPVARRAVN
jgi:proteasome accessory factor A